MTSPSHQARSPEFLSRLHDGELTPGERAHFESHRTHCAECRRAAADFEEALSLYRTSSPSPASPDLAARILRKLQASNRRRDPYGVVFGINLKWAGAFAAALVAMIIGSSVVLRQKAAREEIPAGAPSEVTISVTLEPKTQPEALQKQSAADAAPPSVSGLAGDKEERANTNRLSTSRQEPEPQPARAPLEAEKKLRELEAPRDQGAKVMAGAVSKERAETAARPRPTAAEESGGEGVAPASPSFAASELVVAAPLSIRITSLDDQGTPPDRIGPVPKLPLELRGSEYVLVVDSRGVVYDAAPHLARRKARADDKAAASADAIEPVVPEALKRLRFKPSDRPRRLLLQIE
jgi:hypothetical protein